MLELQKQLKDLQLQLLQTEKQQLYKPGHIGSNINIGDSHLDKKPLIDDMHKKAGNEIAGTPYPTNVNLHERHVLQKKKTRFLGTKQLGNAK